MEDNSAADFIGDPCCDCSSWILANTQRPTNPCNAACLHLPTPIGMSLRKTSSVWPTLCGMKTTMRHRRSSKGNGREPLLPICSCGQEFGHVPTLDGPTQTWRIAHYSKSQSHRRAASIPLTPRSSVRTCQPLLEVATVVARVDNVSVAVPACFQKSNKNLMEYGETFPSFSLECH